MKILVLTPFNEIEWSWFGHDFGGDQWDIRNLNLFGKKPWIWIIYSFVSIKLIKNNDLIISHSPYMSFYVAFAMWITRTHKPHYAFSFNHGNGRFLKNIRLFFARIVFKRVKGFLVFSQREREIYSEYYRIPLSKMSFVHWAVNSPVLANENEFILNHQPYICCMGRNNRDFEIFIKAVCGLGINAIIVCNPHQVNELSCPKNIKVLSGITMEESMRILADSVLSVTPLIDASTGAGHITIVSSMQLGIPQIITELPTVDDYFMNNIHGLFVEQGSVQSLESAISKLINSPDLLKSMSKSSKKFADRWLTENESRKFLSNYLENIRNGNDLPIEPEGWTEFKKGVYNS